MDIIKAKLEFFEYMKLSSVNRSEISILLDFIQILTLY